MKNYILSLILVILSLSNWACDGTSTLVNGVVNNGNGTYTVTVTACFEPSDFTGSINQFQAFFNPGTINIISAAPNSLVFQDGTTWNIGNPNGNNITWAGGTVGLSNPDECFLTTYVLDGDPTQLYTENGGNGCSHTVGMPITVNETCISSGGNFFDTGGPTGDYGDNENVIWTFCPDNPGETVEITFPTSTGAIDTDGSFGDCVDILQVFDGNSTTAAPLGIYCEYDNGPGVITSSDASGCLTFQFSSNASVTKPGWSATVICIPDPNCSITNLAAIPGACVPLVNTYDVDVIVTYTNEPGSGPLDVNGQSFAITASPQTILLTGLISDGNPVDVTAQFSADTGCSLTTNSLFTAPPGCAVNCSADAGTISQ